MKPSSRTPEGHSNHCPVCGKNLRIEPSQPPGDAPCPHCGHLLWFQHSSEPESSVKHERLQKMFEVASIKMAKGEYDYAADLFEQSILGDPSNPAYLQCFMENNKFKYPCNEIRCALAQLKSQRPRKAMNEAAGQEKWEDVIRNGLTVLKVNPWDIPALRAMATASAKMGADDSEMAYLKYALEADPKDPDVNIHCARSFAARGCFDKAISCLCQAECARPNDEEIQREIAKFTAEKEMHTQQDDDAYE